MIFNLKILLISLLALGVVGDDLQAGPRDGQPHESVTGLVLEGDPPLSQVNLECSNKPGIRYKAMKKYFKNFCENWVDRQPHDSNSTEFDWDLAEPWRNWNLKLYWHSKTPTASRNCKNTFKMMAGKKGCGHYKWKGSSAKVVVTTTAHGEEHSGPETYGWILTPPEDPQNPPEDPDMPE